MPTMTTPDPPTTSDPIDLLPKRLAHSRPLFDKDILARERKQTKLEKNRSADVKERLASGALEPAPMSQQVFRQLIAEEVTRWAAVVKNAGIKPE